jgi:hypothetical protein
MRRLPKCIDAAAFVSLTALAACVHTPPPQSPPPPPNLHSPFTGFSSAHYRAPSAWLCLPGQPNNPCDANLDSTEIRPDGSFASDPAPTPTSQRVDCFYVYPTVDMSLSADNHTDFIDTKRIAETARAQVGHFRGTCNLVVPLYRQATIGTYLRSAETRERYLAVAASDVEDAFLHYMGQLNGGRKIVLIGHSQGAEMVVRLLRRFFDDDPAMRERLLLALPIGGNVQVPRDKLVGGTFANIPLCSKAGETGCVVAYRSIVAGTQGASRDPIAQGNVTACVNPTALDGPQHRGTAYLPVTDRLRSHLPRPDDIKTPFVTLRDYYSAECKEGPASMVSLAMSVEPEPSDTRKNPINFEAHLFRGELGLHIVDFQLVQGDLIDLVAHRVAALPP